MPASFFSGLSSYRHRSFVRFFPSFLVFLPLPTSLPLNFTSFPVLVLLVLPFLSLSRLSARREKPRIDTDGTHDGASSKPRLTVGMSPAISVVQAGTTWRLDRNESLTVKVSISSIERSFFEMNRLKHGNSSQKCNDQITILPV